MHQRRRDIFHAAITSPWQRRGVATRRRDVDRSEFIAERGERARRLDLGGDLLWNCTVFHRSIGECAIQ